MDGFKLQFRFIDSKFTIYSQDILQCEAHGEYAVDLEKKFRSVRNNKVVIALAFWKIVTYFDGGHRMKIASHAPISTVYPDPDIEPVKEIKMVCIY
uniref:Putative replication protein A1 n=1 Tax=Arabidopsis thaliana TaxID=3702 RepID=Q9ZQL2_ARATH|nr:putative replication protein A1 [Arabidopsis thaliana]